MFAVVAAFATQAKEMDNSVLVDAYYQPQIWGQPCVNAKMECSTNTNNPICRDGVLQQVFGLEDPTDTSSCVMTLHTPNP